jgi:hypothetical protein
VTVLAQPTGLAVEQRRLSDYDLAFGVVGGVNDGPADPAVVEVAS